MLTASTKLTTFSSYFSSKKKVTPELHTNKLYCVAKLRTFKILVDAASRIYTYSHLHLFETRPTTHYSKMLQTYICELLVHQQKWLLCAAFPHSWCTRMSWPSLQSISTHTLSLRLWAGLMPWAPGKLCFILKSFYDGERNFLIHQCNYFEMNKNQRTKNKSFPINQHKTMLLQNYIQDTQCISKSVLDPDIKILHYY